MKHSPMIVLLFATPCWIANTALAQNQTWIRQLGTNVFDFATTAAAAGTSGAYFGGNTFGALGGPNAGGEDVWLTRYDNDGNQLWIRQFGTSGYDAVLGSSHDTSGGVFIGGFTEGVLGGSNVGASDAWLARYDSFGNPTWVRQLGSSAADTTWSVAAESSGGVFACGDTSGDFAGTNLGVNDAWLARFDVAGNELWRRQFGTSDSDAAFAAATDGASGMYVTGSSYGNFGGPSFGSGDAWLARYDSAGNQLWLRQFGTSGAEYAQSVASDGVGGVYVSGLTYGSLGGPNAGDTDAWFARYDGSGNRLWIRQLGTSGADAATAVAPNGSGGVIVAGYTDGNLGGVSAGGADVWLAMYDGVGDPTWIRQFGTNSLDDARAIALGGWEGAYVSGLTRGDFGAPNAGTDDAWFARYSPPMTSTYCTTGTSSQGCAASISATGTPSASAASGFVITVNSVDALEQGLLFYGIDNTAFTPLPWGASSSYLCVKPPTQRTAVQNSGGTFNQCDGTLSLDWNAFRAASSMTLGEPFSAGAQVFAQAWYRDPPSPKSTMLSDALQFIVQP